MLERVVAAGDYVAIQLTDTTARQPSVRLLRWCEGALVPVSYDEIRPSGQLASAGSLDSAAVDWDEVAAEPAPSHAVSTAATWIRSGLPDADLQLGRTDARLRLEGRSGSVVAIAADGPVVIFAAHLHGTYAGGVPNVSARQAGLPLTLTVDGTAHVEHDVVVTSTVSVVATAAPLAPQETNQMVDWFPPDA